MSQIEIESLDELVDRINMWSIITHELARFLRKLGIWIWILRKQVINQASILTQTKSPIK